MRFDLEVSVVNHDGVFIVMARGPGGAITKTVKDDLVTEIKRVVEQSLEKTAAFLNSAFYTSPNGAAS